MSKPRPPTESRETVLALESLKPPTAGLGEVFPSRVEVPDLATQPVTYPEVDDLVCKYTGLLTWQPVPEDAAGYEEVRLAIADLRTRRVAIESRRKELKESALRYGRLVDDAAKKLTVKIEEVEEPLVAHKKAVDDHRARVKREAEDRERAEREARMKAEREEQEARIREQRARLEAEQKAFEDAKRAAAEEKRREAEALAASQREMAAREAELTAREQRANAPAPLAVHEAIGNLPPPAEVGADHAAPVASGTQAGALLPENDLQRDRDMCLVVAGELRRIGRTPDGSVLMRTPRGRWMFRMVTEHLLSAIGDLEEFAKET